MRATGKLSGHVKPIKSALKSLIQKLGSLVTSRANNAEHTPPIP